MSGIFRNLKGLIPQKGDPVQPEQKGSIMDPIETLSKTIIDTVEEDAKGFLDQNQAARDFVADRAKRLARLAWEYKTASDDAGKDAKKHSMAIVQQSIDNELTAVALQGEAQAKETFKKILNVATKTFVKAIPAILSLI